MARKKPAKDDKSVEPVPATALTFVGVTSAGRPSKYTKALGEMLCALLLTRDEAQMPMSLKKVCDLENMPSESMVYRWLQEHEEFREQYTRTRESQSEMSANDIVMISDTEPDLDRAKVRIDARKWHASKLQPRKYGDNKLIDTPKDGELAKGMSAVTAAILAAITPDDGDKS